MPCRTARPERGSTSPAQPAGISRATPGADAGPLPRLESSPPRPRAGRSRRRRRAPVPGGRAPSLQERVAERHAPAPLTEKRSKRATAPAGTRARTRTPSSVSSRSSSPASSCSSDRLPALVVGQEQLHRVQAREEASLERLAQLARAPRPSRPRPARPRDGGSRARAAARRPAGRPCSGPAAAAARPRRSPPAPPRPRRACPRASCSDIDASATCRIRSASSASSSVAPKASTSWCGSLRMKPTVSVRR